VTSDGHMVALDRPERAAVHQLGTDKPVDVVTRKTDQHQVYFRMVKMHWVLVVLIIGAIATSARHGELHLDFDPGAIYWALVGLDGLGN